MFQPSLERIGIGRNVAQGLAQHHLYKLDPIGDRPLKRQQSSKFEMVPPARVLKHHFCDVFIFMIIFFFGNVGSGKSTLAALTAKWLSWPHFNADSLKKEVYSGSKINPKDFFEKGIPVPAGIRKTLYKEIARKLKKVTKYKNIIIDETLHTSPGRKELLLASKKYFKKLLLIQVNVNIKTAKLRLSRDRKNHILKNAYKMHLAIKKRTRPLKADITIDNNINLKTTFNNLKQSLKTYGIRKSLRPHQGRR